MEQGTGSCIYFIGYADLMDGPVKIGWAEDPFRRLTPLQTGNPKELVLYATARGDRTTESHLHRRFAESRRRGEWFGISEELFWLMEMLGARLGCTLEDPRGPARKKAVREEFK